MQVLVLCTGKFGAVTIVCCPVRCLSLAHRKEKRVHQLASDLMKAAKETSNPLPFEMRMLDVLLSSTAEYFIKKTQHLNWVGGQHDELCAQCVMSNELLLPPKYLCL